jgi:hypothetical protein
MIFDTNIFIYADRGMVSAKNLLMNTPNRAISAITYMEYVPFCRNKKELLAFENLLSALKFKIYEVDTAISLHARQMVKQFSLSHHVEMGDALIAATAISYNELLCTSNAKHFIPINGLMLEIYSPLA